MMKNMTFPPYSFVALKQFVCHRVGVIFTCFLFLLKHEAYQIFTLQVFCWNTQLHTRAHLLLIILCFPEEFGDNPPSSLFHLVSLEQQIHWQQNRPTAYILLAPCWTVGEVFLVFKASPSLLQTLMLIVTKQVHFCSMWPQSFPPGGTFICPFDRWQTSVEL